MSYKTKVRRWMHEIRDSRQRAKHYPDSLQCKYNPEAQEVCICVGKTCTVTGEQYPWSRPTSMEPFLLYIGAILRCAHHPQQYSNSENDSWCFLWFGNILVPGIRVHASTGGLLFYGLLSRSQVWRLSVLGRKGQPSSFTIQNLPNGLENETLRLCWWITESQTTITSRIKLLPKLVLNQ